MRGANSSSASLSRSARAAGPETKQSPSLEEARASGPCILLPTAASARPDLAAAAALGAPGASQSQGTCSRARSLRGVTLRLARPHCAGERGPRTAWQCQNMQMFPSSPDQPDPGSPKPASLLAHNSQLASSQHCWLQAHWDQSAWSVTAKAPLAAGCSARPGGAAGGAEVPGC